MKLPDPTQFTNEITSRAIANANTAILMSLAHADEQLKSAVSAAWNAIVDTVRDVVGESINDLYFFPFVFTFAFNQPVYEVPDNAGKTRRFELWELYEDVMEQYVRYTNVPLLAACDAIQQAARLAYPHLILARVQSKRG